MIDLVLRGGLLVDGTGKPGVVGDLAIADGRIVALGEVAHDGERERRVDGLVVAPGFIDLHSHSDLSILGHPAGTSKVLQGVTTEIVGNCGLGVAPVTSADVVQMLRPLMAYCDDPSVDWDWTSVEQYRHRIEAAAPLMGIEVLAGHNTIRGSVVGLKNRPATPAEVEAMQDMLTDALTDGAVGLSLGLMYPPSCYADEEELVALGRTLATHDALLASHMADYGAGLLDSVDAMIRVAERSGCRVQLSHLAVVGRENWGMVTEALTLVDLALDRGVDVAVDVYPYLAGSTNLSQLLPSWALEGGVEPLRARLVDGRQRPKVLRHLGQRSTGWDEVLLVVAPGATDLEGLDVAAAARQRGLGAEELVVDLLRDGDPTIVAFGRSETDLRAALRHPRSILGSDGLAVDLNGAVGGRVPHPRFFGAFPALFQHYVRETALLSLEEAVRKCTSAPAERVRLRDRGVLCPGMRADVVVLDAATIADRSTYADSRHAPAGIDAVYRGGELVAQRGAVVPT